MFGFIALNKPSKITSHDCVDRVRKILNLRKVGHGGTLDPLAMGVLPIAVGKATRLLQFLPKNKTYRALIRLGVQTITDDLQGEIVKSQSASMLTLEQVEPLLHQFIGTIQQTPPIYSAIQRDGKRLYNLARQGKTVDIPVRKVYIEQINLVGWYIGEFTELEVDIVCGPGTYIRAIARDLGTMLNLGGTLARLTRTESCGMKLSESITLGQLKTEIEQGNFSLISANIALQHLNQILLSETDGKRWLQGQKIVQDLRTLSVSGVVRVYQPKERLLGIGNIVKFDDYQVLMPKVVISNE
ncbi:MAG: tRNA pseudouridine(55) synthase TruB [cyanobacterium endosymbiont of Epithemia adnata isolate EadnSB Bon19]|jgi:tRNA pseudouridine55 synthase|uniref:tRNA pseudouridine(55) synthase TruB n=1 Tax=cyanobacterium endosymbiont of Epithemia turgida TaxID=718217 RepID=UPI0004D0B757|nr:tRNA pseudouridine(55) synthase TruB [cyanobacterium endosymbiont of Epithemia turgida]BAP18541.1 tRNA pseudouridine synthase B [cyanobacterium endosymbiont of Epithemia turgida isolate EtSB Lake Yunoko]